jgi:hypothetical protein
MRRCLSSRACINFSCRYAAQLYSSHCSTAARRCAFLVTSRLSQSMLPSNGRPGIAPTGHITGCFALLAAADSTTPAPRWPRCRQFEVASVAVALHALAFARPTYRAVQRQKHATSLRLRCSHAVPKSRRFAVSLRRRLRPSQALPASALEPLCMAAVAWQRPALALGHSLVPRRRWPTPT